MNKQQVIKIVIILLVVGISGLALYCGYQLFFKHVLPVEVQFKYALKKIAKKYGNSIASNVEKIFRLETANFKSGQFQGTLSPGMEKFSDKYPFGWTSLANSIWKEKPEYAPKKFLPFTENATGKTKYFLKFPSIEASAMTLADFLNMFKNNPGRWYSLNPELQAEYNDKIALLKTPILNSIV